MTAYPSYDYYYHCESQDSDLRQVRVSLDATHRGPESLPELQAVPLAEKAHGGRMTTYTILYHGQSYGSFGSMTEATLVALTLWPCASWTIELEAGR